PTNLYINQSAIKSDSLYILESKISLYAGTFLGPRNPDHSVGRKLLCERRKSLRQTSLAVDKQHNEIKRSFQVPYDLCVRGQRAELLRERLRSVHESQPEVFLNP